MTDQLQDGQGALGAVLFVGQPPGQSITDVWCGGRSGNSLGSR
jgi:hypothetical protein